MLLNSLQRSARKEVVWLPGELASTRRDQVADYASRKAISVAEVERWLGQNLNYDPVCAGISFGTFQKLRGKISISSIVWQAAFG